MPQPLETRPLSYLIGGNDQQRTNSTRIFELSYDSTRGDTAYGNLRDEKGRYHSLQDANERGPFAPYLPPDDITDQYGEYCPDPRGSGYLDNICRQIERKKTAGCTRIELDNPDTTGLPIIAVMAAHDQAWARGLRTVAKNPLLTSDPELYLSHESIDLVICEHGSGGSDALENLRRAVGQPLLAVRFVAFADGKDGRTWARNVAARIQKKGYRNMGVTLSINGEYVNVLDLVLPAA